MAAWRHIPLVVALLLPAPPAARAQGAGRSMDINPSVRSLGMGGACAGVSWGDPNPWGNVASLSRVSGVGRVHTRAQLVPGLATDVLFTSDRLLLGGGGIGASLMGVPDWWDGTRVDYGMSDETDAGGNVIGSFHSYEVVRGAALAFSLPRLLDTRRLARGEPTRYADGLDLSLGLAGKHTYIRLAPASLSGTASATTWDWGVQARVSPLRLIPASRENAVVGLLLFDVGLGYSVVNAMGGRFVFLNEDQASPATRTHRSGVAMRLGAHLPLLGAEGLSAALLSGFDPLVGLSAAHDYDANSAGGTGSAKYTVHHKGQELTIANIFAIRQGRWEDRLGHIDGRTSGWGLGFPLGPWGGFRYDRATIPQAKDSGLPDVTYSGWTAWVDPLRISRDLRAARGARE